MQKFAQVVKTNRGKKKKSIIQAKSIKTVVKISKTVNNKCKTMLNLKLAKL